ncbi:M14 family metallocarboxypeptidase [Metabacillus niabensis]|uniref:G-D-glutamyl-meso-diaminopimelate peptidase n=2 Tax=Metabacillus niabensis TaxID=324854 RepID=A0ABT9YY13_9BACI|nr:M14 family metallocarboxypeptidase [Metabacillus niabensis]MDQ0224879.1 g-D-glutamyl-meso-diaminopimelate peptidase [Metabacillus niabensis]
MLFYIKRKISLNDLSILLQLDKRLILDSNKKLKNLQSGLINEDTYLLIPYKESVLDISSEYVELMNNDIKIMHETQGNGTILNTKKPYDSLELYSELNQLVTLYPFLQKEIIGYSVLGKPIVELKIGNGPKKIHMNGSFHANEWITTSIMMYWLKNFLASLVNNQLLDGNCCSSLYKEVTLSFVPMVNPDGVDLVRNGLPNNSKYNKLILEINGYSLDFSQWKANIRGVDLNNQYPANWEIEKERKIPKGPAPRDYPGDAPLTEPEAIALADIVQKRQFDRVLAFHTQGEEIYWGYLGKEPKEAGQIVAEFERLSGYKAIRNIDSHAGFRDWFVNEYEKSGFTIELGLGVNPLPFEQFDEMYTKSKGIFLAALFM